MRESFGKMICYIFLVCDFQIIVSEVYCYFGQLFSESSAILFLALCYYLFWQRNFSMYFFDEFSGFDSAVFVFKFSRAGFILNFF